MPSDIAIMTVGKRANILDNLGSLVERHIPAKRRRDWVAYYPMRVDEIGDGKRLVTVCGITADPDVVARLQNEYNSASKIHKAR